MASYRPITNLPFLGKVIENMVAEQHQRFLNDLSALDPSLSGFRPWFGTEIALVALVENLHLKLDRG